MAKNKEVKNESLQELRHNTESYKALIKPIITEKLAFFERKIQ